MGWIWSSGSAAPKGDSNSNSNDSATSATTTQYQTPPTKAPEASYSDPEIAKFMAQIQTEFGGSGNGNGNSGPTAPTRPIVASEAKPSATNPTTTPSSSSSSSWWPSWGSSSTTASEEGSHSTLPPPLSRTQQQQQVTYTSPSGEPRLDPVAESVLPTSMSCRQAFDQAFHCNSLGGQWTAVYREGTVRSCSEQWDDFWFCMRTRAYTDGAVKEAAVRDYYRRKELRRYGPGRPSSTDVWEPRPEKLPPGSAFNGAYERPDISDEEWRLQQLERRRAVQRMLREEEEQEQEKRKRAAAAA